MSGLWPHARGLLTRQEAKSMRRAAVPIILVLFVGAAWLAATTVGGQADSEEPVLAQPRKVAPSGAAPAPPPSKVAPLGGAAAPPPPSAATTAKKPVAAPASPSVPAAPAPAGKEPDITPPPQLPDVEIPSIPEVGQDPFKPGPRPVRPKPPDTIDEGKRLFNREGRFEVDQIGRAIFVFDSGDKPIWLLESTWREYLEKVTAQGKKKAHWRVSGIVTVYGGRNYLLLTKVVPMGGEEENL